MSQRSSLLPTPPPPPPPPPVPQPCSHPTRTFYETLNKHHVQSEAEAHMQICSSLGRVLAPSCTAWVYYHHVESVLQSGPKCGLVALSMATQLLPDHVHQDHLLAVALKEGFTHQGEMFSAENMAQLANLCIPGKKADLVHNAFRDGPKGFLQRLINGKVLLVPYDSDHNFSPCCKKGHAAHWAVVIGIAVALKSRPSHTGNMAAHGVECCCITVSPDNWDVFTEQLNDELDAVYILAMHGKSRFVEVWLYEDLRRSNENLVEIKPTEEREFILPANGIAVELCGRIVELSCKQEANY